MGPLHGKPGAPVGNSERLTPKGLSPQRPVPLPGTCCGGSQVCRGAAPAAVVLTAQGPSVAAWTRLWPVLRQAPAAARPPAPCEGVAGGPRPGGARALWGLVFCRQLTLPSPGCWREAAHSPACGTATHADPPGRLPLLVAEVSGVEWGACDAPPPMQSMKPRDPLKPTYQPQEQVELECRPGYRRSSPGPFVLTCGADGTWSTLPESCTRKSCPHPGEPQNGRIIRGDRGFEFGASITFACNEGFFLVGRKELYCELSGSSLEWSDNFPQCEKVRCQPPAKIANGKFSNSGKDEYEFQETVTYSCNPSGGPDPFSLVGQSRLVCSGQDQWSSPPPECRGEPAAEGVLW
ncbi:PREDICTED: membrane cofactor protein [Condylura cristata]|uniref:membrane cofactor protein n=1 Tax=Condylura cristata TaxID=143302 RepID=UPI000642B5BC|nr:PREDICTED: membrane cofactor protein [Condylura cristata]